MIYIASAVRLSLGLPLNVYRTCWLLIKICLSYSLLLVSLIDFWFCCTVFQRFYFGCFQEACELCTAFDSTSLDTSEPLNPCVRGETEEGAKLLTDVKG